VAVLQSIGCFAGCATRAVLSLYWNSQNALPFDEKPDFVAAGAGFAEMACGLQLRKATVSNANVTGAHNASAHVFKRRGGLVVCAGTPRTENDFPNRPRSEL
jgi:hypothetical protein